jgi:ATP-dependent Zn protease
MSANRDKLDALAEALLERETLEQDEAYAAAAVKPRGESVAQGSGNEAAQ